MELQKIEEVLIELTVQNNLVLIRKSEFREPVVGEKTILLDDVNTDRSTYLNTVGGSLDGDTSYFSMAIMCLTDSPYDDIKFVRDLARARLKDINWHIINIKETRDSNKGFPFIIIKFKKYERMM